MSARCGARLFALAFTSLFCELALIRFTSAEVLYLGYFTNFVLISTFLGLGLGFLSATRRFPLFRVAPLALAGLVAFVLATRIDASELRERMGQVFFGTSTAAMSLPIGVALLVLFALTVLVFAGVAQEMGRCFRQLKPLAAYSIDIAGSLAGIGLFTWLGQSSGPVLWFALVLAAWAVLSGWRWAVVPAVAGIAVAVGISAAEPGHWARWSPYQRIEVWPMPSGPAGSFHLAANGIGHQTMQPVGTKEPIYEVPYAALDALHGGRPYRRALIIGSGGGTDTSYALARGVREIDAVEIDPEILAAGRQFHPDRPYDDPRVTVHVDDGRSFMQTATPGYDLIVYALPDSLASLSGFSNIRLETFLFTVESFRQAQSLLAPDGVLVLYNYYRRAWLVAKLADMLTEVFGHPPLVRVFTSERQDYLSSLVIGENVGGPQHAGETFFTASDDWPFLYMQSPRIPGMYLLVMAGATLLALAGVRAVRRGPLGPAAASLPFFFSGAAFLLLETKAVIQFSLLFGATWEVNALVFAAVLLSVLLANLVAALVRIRRPAVLLIVLLLALAAQMLVPLETLLGIGPAWVRYAAASALFFTPIFVANLVFSTLFRDAPESDAAFGWNIVGTVVGGVLEYLAMAVGYQALTFVVAVLYVACFAALLRRAPRAGSPQPG